MMRISTSRSLPTSTMQQDETMCSVLCQHPPCWASQRRIIRGIPNVSPRKKHRQSVSESQSDSDEELGLPTQKVVNLLSDYGEDERDKYPAKYGGKPAHKRTEPYSRKPSRQTAKSRLTSKESYARIPAPQSSPISYNRAMCTSGQVRNVLDPQSRSIGQVEVQEVFDIDDLSKSWQETFVGNKYYVWLPNANRKKKSLEPLGNLTMEKLSQGPGTVSVKDKTEEMIPREVEWHREQLRIFRHAWPVLKKRDRRGRKSPMGAHLSSQCSPQPGGRYVRQQVFYDIMDIPREILSKIVDDIEFRGSVEDQRFMQTLNQLWPHYDRDGTGLSLASSDVLRQKKMKILDKSVQENAPEYYAKEDILEEIQSLPDVTRDIKEAQSNEALRKSFNNKEPLPKIASTSQTSVSRVLLGLPEIPSGLQYTKTFTYKRDQQFDFMLEPTDMDTSHMMDGVPISTTSQPVDRTVDDSMPIHAVSPTYSTNVPHPPRVTPAATSPLTGTAITSGSSEKAESLPPNQHATPQRQPGSGILRSATRSTRNVRFAVDVPPQPPSTPDDVSPATARSGKSSQLGKPMPPTGASMIVNYTESVADDNSLMVVGHGSAAPNGKRSGQTASSPEHWPQINEEQYAKSSPTPPPSSGVSKVSMTHTIPTAPSDTATSELKSPPYMVEAESPAPPPPSPEPVLAPADQPEDPSKSFARGFTGDLLSTLPAEDKDEDSSQYTISAKPPSNLDDYSRINTPNSLAAPPTPNRTVPSRDSTRATMDPVTEEKDSSRSAPPPPAKPEVKEKKGIKLITTADGQLQHEGLSHREDTGLSGSNPREDEVASKSDAATHSEDLGRSVDLDHFDATDQTFKEELKEEYQKLSRDEK